MILLLFHPETEYRICVRNVNWVSLLKASLIGIQRCSAYLIHVPDLQSKIALTDSEFLLPVYPIFTKDSVFFLSLVIFFQEIEAIFALGDINDDGAIDLEEFIGVMYPSASTIANRLRQLVMTADFKHN